MTESQRLPSSLTGLEMVQELFDLRDATFDCRVTFAAPTEDGIEEFSLLIRIERTPHAEPIVVLTNGDRAYETRACFVNPNTGAMIGHQFRISIVVFSNNVAVEPAIITLEKGALGNIFNAEL